MIRIDVRVTTVVPSDGPRHRDGLQNPRDPYMNM